MNTKEPTPNHICGTPDAMCDTDCMGAAGSWPMCDADIDRMERAAIAIETLTANLDALIEANKKLREAISGAASSVTDERLAELRLWLDRKWNRHQEDEDLEAGNALCELMSIRKLAKVTP